MTRQNSDNARQDEAMAEEAQADFEGGTHAMDRMKKGCGPAYELYFHLVPRA